MRLNKLTLKECGSNFKSLLDETNTIDFNIDIKLFRKIVNRYIRLKYNVYDSKLILITHNNFKDLINAYTKSFKNKDKRLHFIFNELKRMKDILTKHSFTI